MLSLTPELLVEDVNQTVDWYRNILGFEILFVSPESGVPIFARIKKGAADRKKSRLAKFVAK